MEISTQQDKRATYADFVERQNLNLGYLTTAIFSGELTITGVRPTADTHGKDWVIAVATRQKEIESISELLSEHIYRCINPLDEWDDAMDTPARWTKDIVREWTSWAWNPRGGEGVTDMLNRSRGWVIGNVVKLQHYHRQDMIDIGILK